MDRTVDTNYDVVVVGGGIVGIGIFRDLCLHQVKTLLIDKKDFCSQTSGASSKMLHGGIRYLEQGDLALVQEALEEKAFWLQNTPHLCYQTAFHLPLYHHSKYSPIMLRTGLMLYDFLSHYKQPRHQFLSAAETLKVFPHLRPQGLKGCGVYHDAVMDDVKLGLECLYDALKRAPTNQALNYLELANFHYEDQHSILTLFDSLTKQTRKVRAKEVVFATGPFSDSLLEGFPELHWQRRLLPSLGSHLWIDSQALPLPGPMVLQTKDNRIIFAIPQKNGVLLGTTEVPIPKGSDLEKDSYFSLQPSAVEEEYLLNSIRETFPTLNIQKKDILGQFAGIRPLVLEEGKSPQQLSKTSRTHHVYSPYHNVNVIVGGKYTTFRRMAQDITRPLIQRLGKVYQTRKSEAALLQKSVFPPFTKDPLQLTWEKIHQSLMTERPATWEDLVLRRIGRLPLLKTPQNPLQFFLQHLDKIQQYFPLTSEQVYEFFQGKHN